MYPLLVGIYILLMVHIQCYADNDVCEDKIPNCTTHDKSYCKSRTFYSFCQNYCGCPVQVSYTQDSSGPDNSAFTEGHYFTKLDAATVTASKPVQGSYTRHSSESDNSHLRTNAYTAFTEGNYSTELNSTTVPASKPGLSNTPVTTTSAPATTVLTTSTPTPNPAVTTVFSQTTTKAHSTVSNCSCKQVVEVQSNLTIKEKKEIAENISRLLSIDKKTLSSTIRSKTSASDNRPSATGIGSVGVIILVLVCGGIAMLDAPLFLKNAKSFYKIGRRFWLKHSAIK